MVFTTYHLRRIGYGALMKVNNRDITRTVMIHSNLYRLKITTISCARDITTPSL